MSLFPSKLMHITGPYCFSSCSKCLTVGDKEEEERWRVGEKRVREREEGEEGR